MALTITAKEIRAILEALRAKHGHGYSDDPVVGPLQAKLSILLEMAANGDGAFVRFEP